MKWWLSSFIDIAHRRKEALSETDIVKHFVMNGSINVFESRWILKKHFLILNNFFYLSPQ